MSTFPTPLEGINRGILIGGRLSVRGVASPTSVPRDKRILVTHGWTGQYFYKTPRWKGGSLKSFQRVKLFSESNAMFLVCLRASVWGGWNISGMFLLSIPFTESQPYLLVVVTIKCFFESFHSTWHQQTSVSSLSFRQTVSKWWLVLAKLTHLYRSSSQTLITRFHLKQKKTP